MQMTTLCYIEKDDKYLMLHRTKKKNKKRNKKKSKKKNKRNRHYKIKKKQTQKK